MLKVIATAALIFTAGVAQAQDRWMSIPQPAAMPAATQSGTAPVNGIEMYYATYGSDDGTPILMIHGGLAHADIWSAQIADLMKDHTVIVADTRGHGRSSNDGSAYSYGLLAADYMALMDHLGVDKVHLVGWSDGANIGYSISQTNPERLASHFAHAGNVTLDGIDPSVETNEVFGGYVGMMAADFAKMSPTPDGFDNFLKGVSTMWATEKPGGADALKSVSVPTLVVQSEFDEAILMDHSKMIAELIPSADLLVLEDTSHFASFQAPGEYTAAIRAFIDR
ncbi:alpha/beta fold hydrolase [Hoeflea sp. TYP-13]|uniref:alpha/beta fold hydrolase n=1 Tax=Hoeflea sp. TYP-13 TaxID=3230023 RepID=UPI0034C6238A